MSAALRIQLMLLARKDHFGKKSDLADLTSLRRHYHAQHSTGALLIERSGATSWGSPIARDAGDCGGNETCG